MPKPELFKNNISTLFLDITDKIPFFTEIKIANCFF